MNKKVKTIVFTLFASSLLLTGCGNLDKMHYQGKERTISEVEEMLADYLESENPDMDLEVSITKDYQN